jgi:hypothetical protein
MADLHSINGGAAAQARANLLELGGLGDDDSCRADKLARALNAFALLVCEQQTVSISGEDLGSLIGVLADEAARINERQFIERARTGR